jgi:hypothetical protein
MSYIPQESDILLLEQSVRRLYGKVQLIDKDTLKAVGELDGDIESDSYSFDADSDIRATYKMTIHPTSGTFDVSGNSKIWYNKYAKLSVGIYNLKTKEIVWYPVGLYLFQQANFNYDASTNSLSLSCNDRTNELDGVMAGQLSGYYTKIPSGSDIHEVMTNLVTQLGFIKTYRIEDIKKTIPYDLKYNTGSTAYDVIKEVRDLYPGWETFFDEDVFICQPYPTCASDPVVLDEDILSELVISEDCTVDLSKVKNVSEVWGKCLDTDYYSESVTYSGNLYTCTNSSITGLSSGMMVGFKAPSTNSGSDNFQVNSLGSFQILQSENAPLAAGKIVSGSSYVLKLMSSGSDRYWYLMGEYQICAVNYLVSSARTETQKVTDLANSPTRNITYTVNASSPFTIDLIGEHRQVLSDSDYENITTEELAAERAEYETWKASDLLDELSLTLLEVPWLGVNQKIRYHCLSTGKTETYIVKSKSGSSTSGVMTIKCVKFQPLYPWNT